MTPHQLRLIDKHLRADNWLLSEELIAELTDHYVAGIIDHMAAGESFDDALRAVHMGFGGRKGLLALEEQFEQEQARRPRRLMQKILLSYLQWPRAAYTMALVATLVYLSSTNVLASKVTYAANFAVAVAVGHFLILLLGTWYRRWKKQSPRLTNQTLSMLYSHYGLICWVVIWPRFFLKGDSSATANWLLSVLVIVTVVVYELAVGGFLQAIMQQRNSVTKA
ncbi:hypothetical protein FAES_4939 [Fibrella aestuarina BUZ 2]|uniref:Uncharacterized protein n=1 Tax=Fibrella aestuarina BUZ 2 TaxID=1166018 RepID=I0KFN5_9BACT|nr:hypothetical protein [Fibrella aestuarina]CCH02938.1 hypothetical protein FAES_4939 [Fibrella aestuarina BUZ 2]